MMLKLIMIFVLGSTAYPAMAGDKVGNGGGLWGCLAEQTLLSGQLVDLYEAKVEYGLTLRPSTLSASAEIDARAQALETNLPEYGALLAPYLAEVQGSVRFVDAKLTTIDDSLYPISPLPASCSGNWTYLQFANYTDQGQVLIRKDLWESNLIPEINKAALVWHEAIYRWLRQTKGDVNSLRARRIVGVLFSTESTEKMRGDIQATLQNTEAAPNTWICLLQSPSSEHIFSQSSPNQHEAQLSTMQACQRDGFETVCNQSQIECDQITLGAPNYLCELHDDSINQIFSNRGRSVVEAKYLTLKTCLAAGAHLCFGDRLQCGLEASP